MSDSLGSIIFQGRGGGTGLSGVSIAAYAASATPSATDMESSLDINLVPAASVTNTNIARFRHSTGFSLFTNPVIDQNRAFVPRQYAAASLPTADSGKWIASSDIIGAQLTSDGTDWLSPGVKRLRTVTAANSAFTLPKGWMIEQIIYRNTTANAVTGGIKIGTTAGAADIVAAQAIGANAVGHVTAANILLRFFSATASQQIFIDAVTAWNAASLELSFVCRKVQ